VAVNKLTTGADSSDRTTFSTAAITPGADRLVVAFVLNAAAFSATAPVPGLFGNGLNWELVDSIQMGNRRLSSFVARGVAPSVGQINIACGNVTQTLCAWSIFEYDVAPGTAMAAIGAHHTGGPRNVSALMVPQNPGLGPNEAAVGGVMLDASRPVAASAGCMQIDVQTPTQPLPPSSATLHTADRTTPGDVGWTWSNNTNAAAIVLTIKLPTPVGPQPVDPVETLIRKFEPILFFDAAEASFPSDAKRYLEHCALWKTTKPYDKSTWARLVPAGQLSAGAGEPGKAIGDPANTVDTLVEERFLELGGWRDRDGTPQSTVSSGKWPNAYANRDEIRSRYVSNPALRDSQFWYHAELFDTTRLLHLAETVQKPDLYKTVTTGLRNPVLLCYYLFFPEHEQAVVGASFTAKEVGGYAGQWACIALLLERQDEQDEHTPTYIGFTGSPTIPPTARASDDEHRVTMKVAGWSPASPGTTNGHPHLFVSRGTHSLYLDNTAHPVDPFPSAKPVNEGASDGQFTEVLDNPDSTIFLIKMLAGPAGWLAAGVEALMGTSDWGIKTGLGGTPDRVPDDAATSPGGITVHPAGMTAAKEWTKPQAWRTAQGQRVNGRDYDFIVDRAAQPWWPSDNGRSGFRGRWGQRVEGDRLPRRAGMRFPEFWRLFLLAVEDGRQSGLLPNM
jgi:hypothetical protein